MAIREVVVVEYRAQGREVGRFTIENTVSHMINGCLLGVSDGSAFGWWGPVDKEVGVLALSIFDSLKERRAALPEIWVERFMLARRHMSAGLGRLAAGALELAIWDLLGYRYSCPVWALFGCQSLERIPAYLTCFGLDRQNKPVTEIATEFARTGWRLQKWDVPAAMSIGPNITTSVGALLAACGGPGCLAIDLKAEWTFRDSAALLAQLPDGLAWIEEPVGPWDLWRVCDLPLAAPLALGEHCYGCHEVPLLMATRAAIWQPDAVFCGGFGSLCKVALAASDEHARLFPHGGGLLPSLHLAAVGFPVEQVEWHILLEPRRQAHLMRLHAPGDDGKISVPDDPGWAGPLLYGLV